MSVSSYQRFHGAHLGVFVFQFLSNEDQKKLGRVDKEWRIAMFTHIYKVLKSRIEANEALFVKDETGIHQERLLRVLGAGGSKQAIELSGGRALLLPTNNIDMKWRRIVHEEVAMSQLLTKIGLLSPLSKQVSFSLSLGGVAIPAYLSETFENFGKTKGWYIIDRNADHFSSWKKGENFLFSNDAERFEEKNWDLVVDSLLKDIAKICHYDLPLSQDAINIAIVKTGIRYEIRYFGLDFSSRRGPLTIPNLTDMPSKDPDLKWAEEIIDLILSKVFVFEFGLRYYFGDDYTKIRNFKNQLVNKYSKEVPSRMGNAGFRGDCEIIFGQSQVLL